MLTCPRCGSNYTKDLEFCGIDGERLAETDDDPLLGKTIDRYRITGLIGDGGMARVYRARHIYLEQDCAIKVLYGEVASDKSLVKRFQREALAAGQIKHKNVVSILDFGSSPEGLLFMAMELLSGRTLSDAIRAEAPYPPGRAASTARAIAEGLQAAHALGFVHRDLKPKNVMLVNDGGCEIPKILDFGLVLLTDSVQGDATSLTRQGQVFGTPAYMAPEQVAGLEVDARADLYSLGVILYQMLAGRVPFEGNAAQIAVHHMSTPPSRLDEAGGLESIAMALLAKDRAGRPRSAEDVIAMIDRLDLADVPPLASSQKPVTRDLDLGSSISSLPSLGIDIGEIGDIGELSALDGRGDIGGEPGDMRDAGTRTVNARPPSGRSLADSPRPGLGGMRWGALFVIGIAVGGGALAYRTFAQAPIEEAAAAVKTAEVPVEPVARKLVSKPERRVETKREPKKEPRTQPTSEKKAEPEVNDEPEPVLKAEAHAEPATPAHEPDQKNGSPPVETSAEHTSHAAGELQHEGPRPSGRTFEEIDLSLGWLLSKRGLNWRDVGIAAPEDVQQWSLWRIRAEHPSPEALDRTATQLEHAINTMKVDKRLVEAKLDRVQSVLAAFPSENKGRAYVSLEERFREAKRLLDRVKKPREVRGLSSEVTMLESDAVAESSWSESQPRAGKIPSATAIPVDPPRIEDTDSSTESRRPTLGG